MRHGKICKKRCGSFPFSDLSDSKRRLALVLVNLKGDDIILCQITSQTVKDYYAISLTSKDFDRGELKQNSNIRPNRLFTADKKIILYKIGKIVSCQNARVNSTKNRVMKNQKTLSCSFNLNRKNN